MILIEKVEQYAQILVAAIPELKKWIVVCDDSQLAEEIKDYTDSDNIFLVGLIPSHKTTGTDVDNVQDIDSMLWIVLEKTDSKDGHVQAIASFKRTQLAAKTIKTKMLTDKPNFSNCGNTMRQLEVASFQIDPLWRFCGCNGYEIDYQLKTPSY